MPNNQKLHYSVINDIFINVILQKKDWISGLLPGIQVVPAGIWAINRAQEHGCSYCFAG